MQGSKDMLFEVRNRLFIMTSLLTLLCRIAIRVSLRCYRGKQAESRESETHDQSKQSNATKIRASGQVKAKKMKKAKGRDKKRPSQEEKGKCQPPLFHSFLF